MHVFLTGVIGKSLTFSILILFILMLYHATDLLDSNSFITPIKRGQLFVYLLDGLGNAALVAQAEVGPLVISV